MQKGLFVDAQHLIVYDVLDQTQNETIRGHGHSMFVTSLSLHQWGVGDKSALSELLRKIEDETQDSARSVRLQAALQSLKVASEASRQYRLVAKPVANGD